MNQELITVNGDLVKQIPLDISESYGVKQIIKIPPKLIMRKYQPVEINLDDALFPVLLDINYRIAQKKKHRDSRLKTRTRTESKTPQSSPGRKTSLIQKLDTFLDQAFKEYDWYDDAKLSGMKGNDIINTRNIKSFERTIVVRKSFTLVTLFEGLIRFDGYYATMFTLSDMDYKELFKVVNKKARNEEEINTRVRAYHMLLTIGQGQLGLNKQNIYPKIRSPLRSSSAPMDMPSFQQTVEKSQN
jgi:hypothetical protein